jgi:hypothetical protein
MGTGSNAEHWSQIWTLYVSALSDAERRGLYYHAERGNKLLKPPR